MLRYLPPPLRGGLGFFLHVVHTAFWCFPLYLLAAGKLLPLPGWRKRLTPGLRAIVACWISGTLFLFRRLSPVTWDIEGGEELTAQEWYLVTCNHQSWVDIPALLQTLQGRAPFPMFFAKRQMLRVPLIGLALWALDFPIMHRYSAAYLERHPQRRGRDLEATRRACARCRQSPVAIINFLEGTRFTPAKHAAQDSPYRHLLRPKAGGAALAVTALEGRLHTLLDVTIVYPGGPPSFWDFLCGRVARIVLRVRQRELPAALLAGDYQADEAFRARWQSWLGDLWRAKDGTIGRELAGMNEAAGCQVSPKR